MKQLKAQVSPIFLSFFFPPLLHASWIQGSQVLTDWFMFGETRETKGFSIDKARQGCTVPVLAEHTVPVPLPGLDHLSKHQSKPTPF